MFPKRAEHSTLLDSEASLAPDAFTDDGWSLDVLEFELLKHFQASKRLAFYMKRAELLRDLLDPSGRAHPRRRRLRLGAHRFLKRPLFFAVLALFWAFALALLACLTLAFVREGNPWLSARLEALSDRAFWTLFAGVCGFFLFLTLAGILKSQLGLFAGLWPDRSTDVLSLGYYAGNVSRVLAPFCLALFEIFRVGNPQFDSIMVNRGVLALVVKRASRFFPAVLAVFYLLTFFDCYAKLKRAFGFHSLRFEDPKSDAELLRLGKAYFERLNH